MEYIKNEVWRHFNPQDDLGSYVFSTKLSIINHLLACLTIFPVLTEYIAWRMQLIFQRWISNRLFKNSSIPSTITERNKLDRDKRNAESYALLRKHLLSFIKPEANGIFNLHNAKGINFKLDYKLVLAILWNTNFNITLNEPFM